MKSLEYFVSSRVAFSSKFSFECPLCVANALLVRLSKKTTTCLDTGQIHGDLNDREEGHLDVQGIVVVVHGAVDQILPSNEAHEDVGVNCDGHHLKP